jgi:hypothetical protein
LRKLLGYRKFVMNRIIDDPVHCPAQLTALAFNPPKWLCSSLRQPGEDRNLRMGHSIRYQDFFAFCVIGDGMRIA